jgi:exosome complex RNA-binding protein Rrp4
MGFVGGFIVMMVLMWLPGIFSLTIVMFNTFKIHMKSQYYSLLSLSSFIWRKVQNQKVNNVKVIQK